MLTAMTDVLKLILLIWGIYLIVKGKSNLTRTRSVQGPKARLLGAIMVLAVLFAVGLGGVTSPENPYLSLAILIVPIVLGFIFAFTSRTAALPEERKSPRFVMILSLFALVIGVILLLPLLIGIIASPKDIELPMAIMGMIGAGMFVAGVFGYRRSRTVQGKQ